MAEPTDEDRDEAIAIVEAVLGRPLGISTATELVDARGGIVLLARTPVIAVDAVKVAGNELAGPADWSAFGMLRAPGADGWRAVEVTYTAGADPEYPDVLAVVESVAGRIATGGSSSTGIVKQESVGAYSVTYDAGAITGANGLTASEAATLARYAVRTELV